MATRSADIGSIQHSAWGIVAVLRVYLLFACVLPAQAAQPKTIPAFKQWTDGSSSYTFTGKARIVVDESFSSQLSPTASTFAQDLLELTGYPIPVVLATGDLSPGDIYLALGTTDSSLGEEGYELTIGDQISIVAQTDAGVFYGTRSVLEMLRQGVVIPGGTARDWPDYPERGLMVDLGRKYFSIPFLERHIKELAYLKLNYFHFHLSDNFGFRLESATHPEITSPQYYSNADIQNLLALARSYHVMIVPEIDVPAHATAMLEPHPELQLPGQPDKLDLGLASSYTFVSDLLNEFLPLFPAPYWHTGADEYLSPDQYADYPELLSYAQQIYGPNANAQDVYVGFVNYVDGIVRAHGKQLRAWNDIYGVTGRVNTPNTDIILEIWTTGIPANDALARGHKIMNCNGGPLYYVLGRASADQADPVNLYENWAPHLEWPGDVNLPPLTPGVLGGKLHVWCDVPDAQTENEVQANIVDYLRSLAQNNWGAPKLVSAYDGFSQMVDQVGHAPGWGPDFTITTSSADASVAAGQTATYSLKLTPVRGFNQMVSLACSMDVAGTSCRISPGLLALDGSTPSTTSVLVSTTASSVAASDPPSLPGPLLPYKFIWAAFVVFGVLWKWRRHSLLGTNWILALSLAGLLSYCLASAGCGGSGQPAPVPPISTPTGTYTIIVQAASGSIFHQAALSLTVQ